jgi:hypothetical protein
MKITNLLPHLIHCLKSWPEAPSLAVFECDYVDPHREALRGMLEDFQEYRGFSLHEFIQTIDWPAYRNHVLTQVDPQKLEQAVLHELTRVESLFQVKLNQEIVIFGAFTIMDGYARFHRGRHQLYLGMDDFFSSEESRRILITHELGHLVREGKPEVWLAWGLPFVMDHAEMVKKLPTLEHVFSEGLSCLISEILNPGQNPEHYVYQTAESYQTVQVNRASVNETVHATIENGHYRELYNVNNYQAGTPRFAHYVWAWRWLKHLHEKEGHSIQALAQAPAKNFLESALRFQL